MLEQVSARTGLHALQHDLVRIVLRVGLGNIGVVDLAGAQLLFQDFDGVLRDHVDRVIDLHLQNQVRSTLQIETEVDVIGQRRRAAPGRKDSSECRRFRTGKTAACPR